jgi:hypothetical protein
MAEGYKTDPIEISHLNQSPSEKRADTRSRKKKAQRIRHLWQQTDHGKRQQWQTKSQKGYDFFLNSQLTQEEEDSLRDAGMPSFIINRITPIIETMKYFCTANSPRWKAVGAGGEDADLAEVHNDIIDYCWYQSSGKTLFSEVILDSLTKSKGYFHIYVDPDADRGMGEVKFERVDPYQVYVSSMCRDYMERDATYQIIKKDLPREELIKKLPQFEKIIKSANGERDGKGYTDRDVEGSDSFQPDDVETPYRSSGQLDQKGEPDTILQYYEMYEPIRVQYYNLSVQIPPPESEMEEAKEGIDAAIQQFAQELEVQFLEKEKELRSAVERGEMIPERYKLEIEKAQRMMGQAVQEQKSLLYNKAKEESSKVESKIVTEDEYEEIKKVMGGQILEAIPYFERKIRKECVVGDQFLYEQILNISSSPLIPIPYLHTQTPYPMSAVIPLIGKQQEINKSHQIMVHNANLSSNLRWMFVEGEIDEDEWERYSGAPGALLKYRQGFSANGPREIMPQNINNAFFTIEQDSKSDMEYIAGIQPPSMGISQGNDETYRGFLAKDEYGTRRIRSWISNVVEPALEHLGRTFHEYAKDIYSVQKIFRIVQPNPGGGFDERQQEINVPIYDDMGVEIGRYNNYGSARYDIRVIAGSTLPINRWAVLEEYKTYLEMGVIDDIAFVQETDIKNKEALLNRKSMLAQSQQQVQAMDEEIKQLNGDVDTLRRQLLQMGIKDELSTAKMEIDRAKTETKAMDRLVQERMRDSLKKARDEMQLEIDKLSNDIKAKTKTNNQKK